MNHLTLPLAIAFLFATGSVSGWILEFCFRNLITHKGPRGKYGINPGFCRGPWLPIYGVGLASMCLMTELLTSLLPPAFLQSIPGKLTVILFLGLTMVLIEFTGGVLLLQFFHIRLWDYRDRPGNIGGIICPLFSVFWTLLGAVYFLLIHKTVLKEIEWFSENLAFSFFVGLFFGVFLIDLYNSVEQAVMIRTEARKRDVVVRMEKLKELVQLRLSEENKGHFFNQLREKGEELGEIIAEHEAALEDRVEAVRRQRRKDRHER